MTKLCIIGGGPVGLDAALKGVEEGMEVTVLEKGSVVGENLRRWGDVQLFSKNKLNLSERMRRVVVVDDEVFPTGGEYRTAVLEKVEAHLVAKGVRIVKNCTVTNVGRAGLLKSDTDRKGAPFRVLAEVDGEEQVFTPFDTLIDASGCYGNFKSPGTGGIPAIGEKKQRKLGRVQSEIPRDGTDLSGKRAVVIGAGYSAATLMKFMLTQKYGEMKSVVWVTRKEKAPFTLIDNDPLPQRNDLASFANGVERRVGSLTEVHADTVVFEGKEGPFTLEYDVLFSLVGFQPDLSITRELRNHICYGSEGPMALSAYLLTSRGGSATADCLQQVSGGAATLNTPEPSFFVAGGKAYARDPTFLLKIGFGQVDDIFQLMATA